MAVSDYSLPTWTPMMAELIEQTQNPTISAVTPSIAQTALLESLSYHESVDHDEPPVVTAAVTPLRYQAATVIAKTLGGSRIAGPMVDYKLAGGTPEQIVNYAIRAFIRNPHTPEAWHVAGQMLKLALSMDIQWDASALSLHHQSLMGLTEV